MNIIAALNKWLEENPLDSDEDDDSLEPNPADESLVQPNINTKRTTQGFYAIHLPLRVQNSHLPQSISFLTHTHTPVFLSPPLQKKSSKILSVMKRHSNWCLCTAKKERRTGIHEYLWNTNACIEGGRGNKKHNEIHWNCQTVGRNPSGRRRKNVGKWDDHETETKKNPFTAKHQSKKRRHRALCKSI